MDRFLTLVALEVMTWHWDGYAMHANNYRAYHDPDSGKVTIFPHGMDQMFGVPGVDVNSPASVSRYKVLLERRDSTRGQVGPTQAAAAQAVARYNATVDEYNRRCAGRLFNPVLMAQISAHPNCPPIP